jgi:phosphatidylglycerophosphatase C
MQPPLTLIGTPVVLRPSAPRPAGAGPAVAVWDVDGTLTVGDTLLPFLYQVAGATRLGRALFGSIARHRGAADRRSTIKAAVLQRLLGGRELAAVDVVARDYVLDLVVQHLRPDSLRRWRWHAARGHRLVIASASLDLYLRHLGDLLGADDVICTRMNVVNGWLTGRLATPNCRGAEKARRVREHLRSVPAGPVWAYGNGAADLATLALADVPVRVRPCRRLPDLARGAR